MMPDLIYCADGNPRYARIALEQGWLYGLRSDGRPGSECVSFLDINWKKPDLDRHRYMTALYRPKYTVMPDVTRPEQLAGVMELAREFHDITNGYIIIVVKCEGIIALIPDEWWIILGYSVASGYGGREVGDTPPPAWEWVGRRVHWLGGNPWEWVKLAYQIAGVKTISADTNYTTYVAQFGKSYRIGQGRRKGDVWKPMQEDGERVESDVPYEAFGRSLKEIKTAWERIAG